MQRRNLLTGSVLCALLSISFDSGASSLENEVVGRVQNRDNILRIMNACLKDPDRLRKQKYEEMCLKDVNDYLMLTVGTRTAWKKYGRDIQTAIYAQIALHADMFEALRNLFYREKSFNEQIYILLWGALVKASLQNVCKQLEFVNGLVKNANSLNQNVVFVGEIGKEFAKRIRHAIPKTRLKEFDTLMKCWERCRTQHVMIVSSILKSIGIKGVRAQKNYRGQNRLRWRTVPQYAPYRWNVFQR